MLVLRKLYLGKKREDYWPQLKEELIQLVNTKNTHQLLYFLPTRKLLQWVREKAAQASNGGIVGLKLVTFQDVIKEILTVNTVKAKRLTKEGRQGVIQHIINTMVYEGLIPEYEKLAGFPGVAKAVGQAIGQIKWSGCKPEVFQKIVNIYSHSADDIQKIKSLAKIYNRYQLFLSNRGKEILGYGGILTDSEEEYWLAIEALSHMVANGQPLYGEVETLIFEQFNDFNQLQLTLIDKLLEQIPNAQIYLPLGKVHQTMPYLHSQRQQLVEWFTKRDFQVIDCQQDASNNPIQQLVDEVFQLKPKRTKNNQIVAIQGCRSKEKEIYWVAREIKKLTALKSQLDLTKIAIIVTGLTDYRDELKDVLGEEEIMLNLARETEAQRLPAFKEIFQLLKFTYSSWSKWDLVKVAQTGYFSYESRPTSDFSKIILQTAFANNIDTWLTRLKHQLNEKAPLKKAAVEEALSFVKELAAIVKPFFGEQTVSEFCQHTRNLITQLNVQGNLNNLIANNGDSYNYVFYQRDLNFFTKLLTVLQQMEEDAHILDSSHVVMNAGEFVKKLSGYLEETVIVWDHGDRQGIQVFEPASAQGLTFDYVFILGLNQGRWPKANSENWLLGDEFRKYLKKENYVLPASSHEEEMEQRQFAHCLLQANKKLFLSYENGGEKGNLLHSSFIEEVKRVFDQVHWEENHCQYLTQAQLWPDWTNASNFQHVKSYLASNKIFADSNIPSWASDKLLDWQQLENIVEIEEKRRQGKGVSWQGVMTDSQVLTKINQKFSLDQYYSATFFNDYTSCPFKFFCKRLLALELTEEAEEELTALDTGIIIHEILQQFYQNYEQIPFKEIDEGEAAEKLNEIIRQKKAQIEIEPLGQRLLFSVEWQRLEKRIKEFVAKDIAINKGAERKLAPARLEFKFGSDNSQLPHCTIKSADNTMMKIRGAIDRIDTAPNGDFIIYDYKLSTASKRGLADLKQGLDFQLLVYIIAYQANINGTGKPLGAAYYSLQDNDRNKGIWLKEHIADLGIKSRTAIGEQEWDQLIDESVELLFATYESIKMGKFPPKPKEIAKCTYCPYADICRFDKLADLIKSWQLEVN